MINLAILSKYVASFKKTAHNIFPHNYREAVYETNPKSQNISLIWVEFKGVLVI